jgi:CheY-like chemotaxis protein
VSNSVDVLVVDDNDLQLEYITELLKNHGLTTHTLINSKEAVDTMEKVKPRLVILDIMMPHLDGFTVLKRMRENKKLADIPVIIHTGKYFPIDEKKARSLGANSFLVKPVKGSKLVEEIKKYI